jgi:hypothetical protein
MHASTGRRACRAAAGIGPAVVGLLIAGLCVARGDEILAALEACPPWVLGGAVLAHLLTLALRTEAWRIVLAGAGGEELDRHALHAANAGAFLAGTVQGSAALAARVALIRQLGGDRAPSVSQIALADAPILLYEVCTSALLAAIASTAVPAIPPWAPALILLGALAALVALRLAHGRWRHRRIAAGLGVLARPALRNRLALVVLAFTAMAIVRTWLVLLGFGLPSDPASVALVLVSMGVIGLLPIGVGTGPTATVASLGTTNLAAATAAGMVVSAATVLAVVVYALGCWSVGLRLRSRTFGGEESGADVIPFPAPATAGPDRGLDLAA